MCERAAHYHRASMFDTTENLILDVLERIGPDSRPYVLDARQTSGPPLPVWEDGNRRGVAQPRDEIGHGWRLPVSVVGREHLRELRLTSVRHTHVAAP
jgi:hypothetical protein